MTLVRVGVVKKKAGEKPHRVAGVGPRNSEDSKASSTPAPL